MENQNEMVTKKKGNKTTIVIALLVIIIIALIGYICYDNGIILSKVENETKETNTKNKKEESSSAEDKNNNDNATTTKELDLSKSLNTSGITYKNASNTSGDYGLSMNINSDMKSVTLSIDWNKFGPISGASAWASETANYMVTGFSKNISSTFIGELGQDSTGVTLFYLMEDGTVEYTPMFVINTDSAGNSYYVMNYTPEYSNDGRITGEHFETKGQINGVTDVIKLYNVDASSGSGWKTTIGVKNDGSFYDLGDIIK